MIFLRITCGRKIIIPEITTLEIIKQKDIAGNENKT